jgi:hypothetical protein
LSRRNKRVPGSTTQDPDGFRRILVKSGTLFDRLLEFNRIRFSSLSSC